MDKRMNRTTVGQCGLNRNASPYRMPDRMMPDRMQDPACGGIAGGYTPDDMYMRDRYDDGGLENFPLAMCYVPWQQFRDLQENEFVALAKGTLFKELDLDWYGRGCK